jgi:hypothetical protein
VVKAEGVLGVVYKVGEVIQVWVGKGLRRRCVEGGGIVGEGCKNKVGR